MERIARVGRETLIAIETESDLVDIYIDDPIDGRHRYAAIGDAEDRDNLRRSLAARYGTHRVDGIMIQLGLV